MEIKIVVSGSDEKEEIISYDGHRDCDILCVKVGDRDFPATPKDLENVANKIIYLNV